MNMKASVLIIGMIAGTFGLSVGADIHEIRGALVIVAATVGMVGAAFSISKQRIASILMILASVVGAIDSTILFGIAALFTFLGRNTTKATHQLN